AWKRSKGPCPESISASDNSVRCSRFSVSVHPFGVHALACQCIRRARISATTPPLVLQAAFQTRRPKHHLTHKNAPHLLVSRRNQLPISQSGLGTPAPTIHAHPGIRSGSHESSVFRLGAFHCPDLQFLLLHRQTSRLLFAGHPAASA